MHGIYKFDLALDSVGIVFTFFEEGCVKDIEIAISPLSSIFRLEDLRGWSPFLHAIDSALDGILTGEGKVLGVVGRQENPTIFFQSRRKPPKQASLKQASFVMLAPRPRIRKIEEEGMEAVWGNDVTNDECGLRFQNPDVLRTGPVQPSERPNDGSRSAIDPQDVPLGMVTRQSLYEPPAPDPDLRDEWSVAPKQ